MKTWIKLEKWWDNGMFSLRVDADRYDSLLILAIVLFINFFIGIVWKYIYIPTIFLGIFCLLLDNHNLRKLPTPKQNRSRKR